MEWENHKSFVAALVTLVVGIFLLAYILFSINRKIERMGWRLAKIERELRYLEYDDGNIVKRLKNIEGQLSAIERLLEQYWIYSAVAILGRFVS